MLERCFLSPMPGVTADAGTEAAQGPESGELKALRKANAELSRQCVSLAATAQRYRSLFNAIDTGFCIIEVLFDPEGTPVDYRFVEVNSAFEEQTGLKDAAGKSVREFMPDHEQHWFQIYGHVALSGQPIRFQNRAAALNRWYDAYAFRVGPPQDHTVGVLFTDITARKRTEEQLRDREQQLRFIADHLPLMIVHCDADTRYKFVNAAYAQQFGIDPEKVIGRKITDVVEPAVYDVVRPHIETALRGQRVEFEEMIPYEKLGERWMHGVYLPEKTPDGQVVGFVAVVQDITKRKNAERALSQSELRFRSLMEQAPFSIQIFAPDGRTLRVNRAWEELWGVTLDQVADYNVLRDPQLEAKGVSPFIARAFAGAPVEIPAVQYDPNQTIPNRTRYMDPVRWVAAVAYPLFDERGRVREVVLVHQDITQRKRAEEELAKTQQELKDYAVNLENTVADRTAKLRETVQDLEAFSYSIAHDMRAPLRAMRGFASILEEEHATRLDAVALSYLHRISNAAHRLDQLILDILDYSKIVRDELRLAPVNLHKLVREILASYPQFDSSRVDIVVEGPLPVVLANNAAMTQVLSNILTNAVKFVTPGVRPRVRIRAEDVRNDPAFPNGAARLWVEDNGIGIPARAQSRLFEIFTRFEDAALYEGTGIGLAIVKKAVERMRGTIGVESEPGKGSRFWVQLHRPSNVPPTAANTPTDPPRLDGWPPSLASGQLRCSSSVVRFGPEQHQQFTRNGFLIVENVLTKDAVEQIRAILNTLQRDRANIRNVLASAPRIRELLRSNGAFRVAEEVLDRKPHLTRAILFDKKPGANWAVGWHQDIAIAVLKRLDVPGFAGWSVKEGITHVHPPVDVLEQMVTVRIHIDDCAYENGPLQVLPASHLHGRLSNDELNHWSQRPAVTCVATPGSAILMRPLLIHRSSQAKAPSHRRVLHLEFAASELPGGLEWNVA
jgi:PAS domain S-box-containing protein